MTAVVAFPKERVVRTPAQVVAHRRARMEADVARLVDLLEHDPRFAHIRAMLEERSAGPAPSRELQS